MTREEILAALGGIIVEASSEDVDWAQVTEKTDLESFGFDSLAVLDLIFDIEQELSVQIPADEVLTMETVGDLIHFISIRLG